MIVKKFTLWYNSLYVSRSEEDIVKKLISLIIISALLITLTACMRSADDKPSDKDNEDKQTDAPVIDADVLEEPDTNITESPDTDGKEKTPPENPEEIEENTDGNTPEDVTIDSEEPFVIPTQGEPDPAGIIAVTAIELDRSSTTIHVGQVDMPWETVYPYNATNKSTYWQSSDPSVASVDEYGRVTANSVGQCVITDTSVSNPEVSAPFNVTVDPSPLPAEPTYFDGIMIANKSYPLPETYNPGIDPTAQTALDTMIASAASDGISLYPVSAFRSYQTQQGLYARYLLREGRDAADRYSARPGYSEHQTGLAFDLNSVEFSFADTAEGKWLAAHCAEYGFIIRYPEGKESVTGYMYEPWHVRYLGVEKAIDVTNSGLTLEEYLGITSEYARY